MASLDISQAKNFSSSKKDLLLLPEVQRLVACLRDRSITEFVPFIPAQGEIEYPEASRILNANSNKSSEILERLAEVQILSKEEVTPIAVCPSCGSKETSASLVCPNCEGTELVGGKTLQHLSCLHFDFESKFEREGRALICPKCNRELTQIGVDHLRPGTFFKCSSCSEFTARAKRLVVCHSCHQVSETPKAPPIYAYKFLPNSANRVSADAYSFDYAPVFASLARRGYEIRTNGEVRGKSGVDHPFSVVATRAGAAGTCVVLDVELAAFEVEPESVLALFAKSTDCNIKSRIIIAVPRLSEEAKVLARSYGISCIEAMGSVDAGEKLESLLVSLSVTLPEKQKSKQSRKRGSIDIMADILAVVSTPSSKYEMMACANLSYDQCQKYVPLLEKLGLVRRYLEDGFRIRYVITEKGREYLSSISGEFGKIAEGGRSIWPTKRKSAGKVLQI